MKKQFAPTTESLENIFKGIQNGTYYTSQSKAYTAHGFEFMKVDINASEFDVNIRHSLQTVEIPVEKRGNLSKYAGKFVDVIVTGIARSGARVEFYIRERK